MTYITNRRTYDIQEFLVPATAGLATTRVATANRVEYVYSFRTGGEASVEKVSMPKVSGSVQDMIKDRARFYRDISETWSANSSFRKNSSEKRFSKTDTGHAFASFKRWDTPCDVTITRRGGGPSYTVPVRPCLPHSAPSSVQELIGFYTGQSQAVPWASKSAEVSRFNSVMSSMAPDRAKLDIGESLASLFLGQFPTTFKSLPNLLKQIRDVAKKRPPLTRDAFHMASKAEVASTLKGVKETAKVAGGDYLNYLFAWSPLVADVVKTIQTLLQVDTLAYGESSRRSASWPGDSGTIRVTSAADLPVGYGVYDTAGQEILEPRFNGKHSAWFSDGWINYSTDYRMRIRFVSKARPTAGANGFTDKAQSFLEDIGLISPTLWYELLPFSWLVDWWAHLGTSLENVSKFSAVNGLYPLDYAYVTRVTKVLATARLKDQRKMFTNWDVSTQGKTCKTFHISKERMSATPFGFGGDLSSLTGSQMTILTALGLASAR